MKKGIVQSVSKSGSHTFSKYNCDRIILIKGLGVEGDAPYGKKCKTPLKSSKRPKSA